MPRVLVVVPGFMGSTFAFRGRTIWPATLLDFVLGYPHADELLEADLQVTGVIERYAIAPLYCVLFDDLERMGYRRDETWFVCPYDWRRSHLIGAETLAECLDGIVEQVPDARITLIGHSMGGTVARAYLETGLWRERPGWRRVTDAIYLGTPHRGAVNLFPGLIGQTGVLWLNAPQAKRIASDPRYPAAYELLPGPDEPWVWQQDRATWPPVDLYRDRALADELGLVRDNLEQATLFHARMAEGRRPEGVRYFCFQGTWHKTPTAIALHGSTPRTWSADHGGDGAVPIWSSGLPGVQSLAVGGEHWTLYKDAAVRRTLAALLGSSHEHVPSTPVEIVLSRRAVAPGKIVPVALQLPCASDAPGTVQLERPIGDEFARVGNGGAVNGPAGVRGAHATVTLRAPEEAGQYRVAYYREGQGEPADTDVLIVRSER